MGKPPARASRGISMAAGAPQKRARRPKWDLAERIGKVEDSPAYSAPSAVHLRGPLGPAGAPLAPWPLTHRRLRPKVKWTSPVRAAAPRSPVLVP